MGKNKEGITLKKFRNRVKIIGFLILWSICFIQGVKVSLTENPIGDREKIVIDSSHPLYGKKIVVDAGHGGSDPGTIGPVTNVYEADLNLDIAYLLKNKLEKIGVEIIMTRTKENTQTLGNDNKFEINERGRIIEAANADMVISIHQNFNKDDSSIKGAQILIRDKKNEELAQALQNAFNLKLETNLNYLLNRYEILSYGKQPSFILECGFFSNVEDERNLQTSTYKDKILDILCEELEKHIGEKI